MISTNNTKARFRDRDETKLAVMTTSNTKPRTPRSLPQGGLATARPTRDVRGVVLTNTNYKEIVAGEKARTLGARISKLRKERKAVLAKAAAKKPTPAPAKEPSKKAGKKGT